MSDEQPEKERSFFPQYCIISKFESRYHRIKAQLLDTSRFPAGFPCYFVRACRDTGCICRIWAGKGAVMFYEVIDHEREGISDEDIREAMRDPRNACPRPGYYYITQRIERKLQRALLRETCDKSVRHSKSHMA